MPARRAHRATALGVSRGILETVCLSVLMACAQPRPLSEAGMARLVESSLDAAFAAKTKLHWLCGSQAPPSDSAVSVLFASAKACLSCRDVGFVVRRLADVARLRGAVPVVAVSDSEEKEMCSFLAAERMPKAVRVAALSTPDAAREMGWLIWREYSGAGVARDSLRAPTGIDMSGVWSARTTP